ncbi:sensor histidine kinase/response regulator Fos-1/TcsA [Acephala macrosclerotiorum]|nr:sensor histidine kinase/response regulator Fos-1/TcsA [Acephala macrosclerotiorum]
MDSSSDNELTPTKLAPTLPTLEEFLTHYPASAVLLDPSYRILKASDKFLSFYGLAEHRITGSSLIDIINEFKLIPDADSTRAVVETARSSGEVYIADDIKGEEDSFWTLQSNPIIKGGETTTDHLDRKYISDQMDSSDSYRILVQQVKDYAMFMLDPAGMVKTWNVGAQLLKGYTKEEIVGRHFSTFYTPDDLAAGKPQKEIEIALREGKVEDESWRIKKNGERFWANVIITAVYRGGVHIGFAKVTRDLTERKAAETRLIESYKQSDKMKTELLANMSHEIRTPMNGLTVSLDLLLDTLLNDEQLENVKIMKESAALLTATVNDVLDYSKLEASGFTLNLTAMNVANIATVVVRSHRVTLKPGLLLELTCSDNLPPAVKGDALRFRQVLQNLVANAIKFTEGGCVSISMSAKESHIGIGNETNSFMILTKVTDTGIGIAENDIPALFNRFSQLDASATKKYKGTGLGLAISKGLAELMGGQIGYYPNPDTKGSVFWFTIKADKVLVSTPLDEADNEMESINLDGGQTQLPIEQLRAIAPTKRLLLVEDNVINQKVAVQLLKNLGFADIETCANGAEAVQFVKEDKVKAKENGGSGGFDGVLMDISMPIMDGVSATMEIRRAGFGLPIIAMTANAFKGDVDGYLVRGINGYISKPVDKAVLVDVLLRWLK